MKKASGCAVGLRLWSSLADGGSEPFSFGTEGKWTPFLRPAGEVNPFSSGSRGKWIPLLWAVRGSEPLSWGQWGEVNPSTRSGARMRPPKWAEREGSELLTIHIDRGSLAKLATFLHVLFFVTQVRSLQILNKKWEVIERLTSPEGIIRREARRRRPHGEEI
jgi:hypothetical protein